MAWLILAAVLLLACVPAAYAVGYIDGDAQRHGPSLEEQVAEAIAVANGTEGWTGADDAAVARMLGGAS